MLEELNDNWDIGPLERPFGRGVNISMSVDDVEGLFNKLKSQGLNFFLELETHSYRVENIEYQDKEFLIQDPDGYLLRFNN